MAKMAPAGAATNRGMKRPAASQQQVQVTSSPSRDPNSRADLRDLLQSMAELKARIKAEQGSTVNVKNSIRELVDEHSLDLSRFEERLQNMKKYVESLEARLHREQDIRVGLENLIARAMLTQAVQQAPAGEASRWQSADRGRSATCSTRRANSGEALLELRS